MSQILIALSIWLHALATIILIGHYLLLSLIYLPVLAKDNGPALSEISRGSRSWLYISLVVFAITGTYLMLIDSGYLGFYGFWQFLGRHDVQQARAGLRDDRAGILVQRLAAGGADDVIQ